MKKSAVAIISVVCTLAVCMCAFLITDYFAKRDGRTRESRELIVREDCGADFVTCEEKNDIKYLCLKEIDKESGHPTELGMKQISEQVEKLLSEK